MTFDNRKVVSVFDIGALFRTRQTRLVINYSRKDDSDGSDSSYLLAQVFLLQFLFKIELESAGGVQPEQKLRSGHNHYQLGRLTLLIELVRLASDRSSAQSALPTSPSRKSAYPVSFIDLRRKYPASWQLVSPSGLRRVVQN